MFDEALNNKMKSLCNAAEAIVRTDENNLAAVCIIQSEKGGRTEGNGLSHGFMGGTTIGIMRAILAMMDTNPSAADIVLRASAVFLENRSKKQGQ